MYFSSHFDLLSYLLPLRQSKTKRKTPVIRRTREAFWDYQSEYDVDFDELPELGIEFLVSVHSSQENCEWHLQ